MDYNKLRPLDTRYRLYIMQKLKYSGSIEIIENKFILGIVIYIEFCIIDLKLKIKRIQNKQN